MKNKTERKESYFLGSIGGIIGGILISIPLIFGYTYSESIFVLSTAMLIPFFEFYGYKWFKGKINNKFPTILLILTIISILVMIFIFIPVVLLIKSNLPISFGTIRNLYKNNNVLMNMLQDFLISLVFALLGVYIVGVIIKRKLLLEVSDINLFSSDNKEKKELKEKAIGTLKHIFEKYGATQKDRTITKQEVLIDLKENKFNDYFKYLKQLHIIKKYKGKYYYSVDDEKNIKIHYSASRLVVIMCIVFGFVAIILFSFGIIMNSKIRKVYNSDISFNIDKSWNILEDYKQNTSWIYYKYLDTGLENSSEHSYPARIAITYDKTSSDNYSSINDLKSILETYINNYLNYNGYDLELFTTSKGYDAIELIMNYETTMEFYYYIYKDGKIAYITAISYSDNEETLNKLGKYAREVVNSFEWNK